jgi:transcriptional regulator with XRE-family HTH domain
MLSSCACPLAQIGGCADGGNVALADCLGDLQRLTRAVPAGVDARQIRRHPPVNGDERAFGFQPRQQRVRRYGRAEDEDAVVAAFARIRHQHQLIFFAPDGLRLARAQAVRRIFRLRVLRKDAGLTQAQLAALADTNQAAINRYETDRAAAPYRILVWYATYFNVSLDYIFGLCENPRGRYVCVTPEGAQEVVQCKPVWSEFVEACFTPGSELNRRLKQMILNMGEEEKHK